MDSLSKPVPVRFLTSDYRNFQNKYPRCFSRFLKRCVYLALHNLDFFEFVMFGNLDSLDFKKEVI